MQLKCSGFVFCSTTKIVKNDTVIEMQLRYLRMQLKYMYAIKNVVAEHRPITRDLSGQPTAISRLYWVITPV